MQFTTKIMTAFVFMLLTICSLQAQRPEGGGRGGDPKERANQQTDRMVEALDLSAAQGEKIKALNLEYADKMLLARKEARESGNREGMRTIMQTMRKEQNEKLKKYLTAEQLAKWEKMLADRPQRKRGEGRKKKGKEKAIEGNE